MATVAIRTCDRCGKGVHVDASRVALAGTMPDLIDNQNITDRSEPMAIVLSIDLCTRCTDSLRAWASEIRRRAAAKQGGAT